RIERLGREMRNSVVVDITPKIGSRHASAAKRKDSNEAHDDFAGGARIARSDDHRWNEANWIGSRCGAKFLPSARPDRLAAAAVGGQRVRPARSKRQTTLELVLQLHAHCVFRYVAADPVQPRQVIFDVLPCDSQLPCDAGAGVGAVLVALPLHQRLDLRTKTPRPLHAVHLLPVRGLLVGESPVKQPVECQRRLVDLLFQQDTGADFLAGAWMHSLELDQRADVDPGLARLCELKAVLPFECRPAAAAAGRMLVFGLELGPPPRGRPVAQRELALDLPMLLAVAIIEISSLVLELPFALLDARRVDRVRFDGLRRCDVEQRNEDRCTERGGTEPFHFIPRWFPVQKSASFPNRRDGSDSNAWGRRR